MQRLPRVMFFVLLFAAATLTAQHPLANAQEPPKPRSTCPPPPGRPTPPPPMLNYPPSGSTDVSPAIGRIVVSDPYLGSAAEFNGRLTLWDDYVFDGTPVVLGSATALQAPLPTPFAYPEDRSAQYVAVPIPKLAPRHTYYLFALFLEPDAWDPPECLRLFEQRIGVFKTGDNRP